VRPVIVQDEEQIGFYWQLDGRAIALPDLLTVDEEPDRLLPTHLEALDDALIIATGRFGEVLGGGRRPDDAERQPLVELHRCIDRLVHEYAVAAERLPLDPIPARAGQIVGTAALVGIMARRPLGLLGPAPLDHELDAPEIGVVEGYGDLLAADPSRPWRGSRWVVRATDGRRFPASLAMLLYDSSGVLKDAALDEHRAALNSTVAAAANAGDDAIAAACAIDWLLYDWLMAHRDGPDSGAVEIRGPQTDAAMIVRAASMSVACRSRLDPHLLRLPSSPVVR